MRIIEYLQTMSQLASLYDIHQKTKPICMKDTDKLTAEDENANFNLRE